MEIISRYLNKYDTSFGLIWRLKKLYCKIFGHNYEMRTIIDNDIPFHVYKCRKCGKLSFKTCEDTVKKTAFSRAWFSRLMVNFITIFLIMYGVRIIMLSMSVIKE